MELIFHDGEHNRVWLMIFKSVTYCTTYVASRKHFQVGLLDPFFFVTVIADGSWSDGYVYILTTIKRLQKVKHEGTESLLRVILNMLLQILKNSSSLLE